MLFCRDMDGPIYVKVGRSGDPLKRYSSLKTACPIPPVTLAICEVRSTHFSKLVERDLHSALRKWRKRGEWFILRNDEKEEFKSAWQPVMARYREGDIWPMRWAGISCKALEKYQAQKKRVFQRRYTIRGDAYRDFLKHAFPSLGGP